MNDKPKFTSSLKLRTEYTPAELEEIIHEALTALGAKKINFSKGGFISKDPVQFEDVVPKTNLKPSEQILDVVLPHDSIKSITMDEDKKEVTAIDLKDFFE